MDFDIIIFKCYKKNTHSWHTSNLESAKKKLSLITLAVFHVVLVSNYYGYKGETIKLLPCLAAFCKFLPWSATATSEKIRSPFLAAHLRRIENRQAPKLLLFFKTNILFTELFSHNI